MFDSLVALITMIANGPWIAVPSAVFAVSVFAVVIALCQGAGALLLGALTGLLCSGFVVVAGKTINDPLVAWLAHPCDAAAAMSWDPDKPLRVERVLEDTLRANIRSAEKSCRVAANAQNAVPRHHANYARILDLRGAHDAARRQWQLAADGGHAVSLFRVGQFHAKGEGTFLKDQSQAQFWYQRSAEKGYPRAMREIALTYLERGDLVQAFHWFERANELGDVQAPCKLAEFYLDGRTVARDPARAEALRKICAERRKLIGLPT